MAADIISSTTQQFLDIHDIVNNFVIMKDGTVSVILAVDAMNFGLLAEEEQDAVMYAYAGLLNSLNYTIQIVINSQTKDVTSYLQLLKDQESSATNETIRRRIRQYREFVGNLIHDRNVLDKKFYVVIPANSIELGFAGAKSVLPGQSKFDITSIERSILLEKSQNILDPRRDHLIAQFARIGLFSRQLTTQEIIQLFYIRYNPEAAEGQQIGESSSYASPLVQASIQGSVMNTDTVVPPTAAGAAAPTPPVQTPPAPQEQAPDQTGTMPGGQMPDATTPAPTTPSPDQPAANTPPVATPPQPGGPAVGSPPPMSEPATPTTPPVAPTMPTPDATPDPSTLPGAGQASTDPVEPAPITTPDAPQDPASGGTSPATPSAEPATPTTPPAADAASDMDVQADLNETIKQLGVQDTPTPQPAANSGSSNTTAEPSMDAAQSAPATNDGSQAKAAGGDLPPLPEI